jgi:hypothetical protein
MSQKSSVPQVIKSVSQVLTPDIVAIDVRTIGKFLLGQAFGLPYPA